MSKHLTRTAFSICKTSGRRTRIEAQTYPTPGKHNFGTFSTQKKHTTCFLHKYYRINQNSALGEVHLVCVPIGHAGTLLAETAEHLAMALATRRPQAAQGKTHEDLATDHHALPHDRRLANNLLVQLSDLAATRLLHTIAHRQAELQKLSVDSPPPFASRKRQADPSSTCIT